MEVLYNKFNFNELCHKITNNFRYTNFNSSKIYV